MVEKNLRLYERHMQLYGASYLELSEQAILRRFHRQWADTDMLDIGVGAGRTSCVFSAIVQSYTGIDYATRAIELCRRCIGESDRVRFLVCDARDMARHLGRKYHFVMFSQNGLDSMGHEDRRKVLAEVRSLLHEDGHFFFSSHSLVAPPRALALPVFNPWRPMRSAYRSGKACVQHLRFTWINRSAYAAKERGWTIIQEDLGGQALAIYYVIPALQVKQLAEAGLQVVHIYDRQGRIIDPDVPTDDLWVHYLCRAKP